MPHLCVLILPQNPVRAIHEFPALWGLPWREPRDKQLSDGGTQIRRPSKNELEAKRPVLRLGVLVGQETQLEGLFVGQRVTVGSRLAFSGSGLLPEIIQIHRGGNNRFDFA